MTQEIERVQACLKSERERAQEQGSLMLNQTQEFAESHSKQQQLSHQLGETMAKLQHRNAELTNKQNQVEKLTRDVEQVSTDMAAIKKAN